MAAGDEQSRAIRRIVIPDQYATTFERLENNVALLVLEQDKGKQQAPDEEDNSVFKQTLFRNISRTAGLGNPIPPVAIAAPSIIRRQQAVGEPVGNRRNNSSPPPTQYSSSESSHQSSFLVNAAPSSQPESSSYICLSSIINLPSPETSNICQTYSWRKLRKSTRPLFIQLSRLSFSGGCFSPTVKSVCCGSTLSPLAVWHRSPTGTGTTGSQRRRRQNHHRGAVRQQNRAVRQNRTNGGGDDGANYITANISIFPANGSECRREHRDYLQHQGNLCAGPEDRSRSLHVELSGSPLICTERNDDGTAQVELRGLLTWSTDINRAPHLFTNLTTYRSWIEDELDKLDQLELLQQSS
ncbi:AAEL011324-PA [Aedes aegypti]|uniref:AAEL011324-PA n=1 Tax=Aedes aegypti TaxID=7159 RepID=Q16QC8_AEDAE|nr:AAEL011324-PA [Aedes aegypti]